MPLTRRNFLISGSLSLAAGAFSPLLVQAEKMKPSALVDFKDWGNQCAGSLNWLLITFIWRCSFWRLTPGRCARRLSNTGHE